MGAISHTAGVVTAVVALRSECGGIGIDIEERRRYFPELVDLIAFGDERRAIRAAVDPVAAAVELFSAKESIYKAFSPRVGRYFGFPAARISWVAPASSPDSPNRSILSIRRTETSQLPLPGHMALPSLP